ncbi:MAG TPA: Fic family protein [Salinisphaeraceae bacterium]|nr:Fic family protein [Salinisphaeraceae bacterium]
MHDRYTASGQQVETQPGSAGKVLRNLQSIRDVAAMAEVELFLLEDLYRLVFETSFPERQLTVADLQNWHYRWLGNVYPWAGEERSVNMGKGGFQFAAAARIPRLLQQWQKDCLDRFTPAHGLSGQVLVRALAVTHVELILIHPFREGNGRISRLLADVMAVQAGCNLLDYSSWDERKAYYFSAIQRGLERDYQPMMQLMASALRH